LARQVDLAGAAPQPPSWKDDHRAAPVKPARLVANITPKATRPIGPTASVPHVRRPRGLQASAPARSGTHCGACLRPHSWSLSEPPRTPTIASAAPAAVADAL